MRTRPLHVASLVVANVLLAACGSNGSTPPSAQTVDPDAEAPSGDVGAPGDAPGVGDETGGHDPGTILPPVPPMGHVSALVRGNSALISFDPVAGAKDYRAYVLPKASDVKLSADGSLAGVDHAIYRCAGRRAAPPVWVDGSGGPGPKPIPDWIAVDTLVDGKDVAGVKRPLAEATLGYAFEDPTPETIPIYAVGDPAASSDNYGYGIREPQTRGKLYVTDRAPYVTKGYRDDGVVFYAPSSATSHACGASAPIAVHTLDVKEDNGTGHLYYASPTELAARGAGTSPFFLCPSEVTHATPVMRSFYQLSSPGGAFGGRAGSDELSLGSERFLRARCQGSTFGPCANASQASWEIQWSNITGPVTLIVEALDAGCPFQGLVAATPLASLPVSSGDNNGDTTLKNDPVFTLSDLQSKSPTGEVFLNGHYDPSLKPKPIARAAIDLSPEVRPAMDFASDFASHPESFSEVLASDGTPDCGLTPDLRKRAKNPDTCDGGHRLSSPTYDVLLMDVDDHRYGVGVTQGELFTAYSGGKFRITPKTTHATMSDTKFVHAAMEVSSFSTGRRYPQIIISQEDMITSQWLLERSPPSETNESVTSAVYLHPIDAGVGRPVLELEVCNHRAWQVNNHCPWFVLDRRDPKTATGVGDNLAHPDLFDRLQDDRLTRFDLYLSTQRAYVYLDAKPYACVDLAHRKANGADGAPIVPTPTPPPAGPVTVTFGDVQYHAGAESGYFEIYSPFHLEHMLYETIRHFDYVGFKSNEPQPPWDEVAFPCITQMYQGGGAGTQTPETGN